MVAANEVFGAVRCDEAISIALDVLERETNLAVMLRMDTSQRLTRLSSLGFLVFQVSQTQQKEVHVQGRVRRVDLWQILDNLSTAPFSTVRVSLRAMCARCAR
jgi:hypothetical protein